MDVLQTDNIYAAKWTYQDDVTKEGMAEVCMSNYDPDFGSVAKPNDILVSGYNFGCVSFCLGQLYRTKALIYSRDPHESKLRQQF